jgi:hypothetical protein
MKAKRHQENKKDVPPPRKALKDDLGWRAASPARDAKEDEIKTKKAVVVSSPQSVEALWSAMDGGTTTVADGTYFWFSVDKGSGVEKTLKDAAILSLVDKTFTFTVEASDRRLVSVKSLSGREKAIVGAIMACTNKKEESTIGSTSWHPTTVVAMENCTHRVFPTVRAKSVPAGKVMSEEEVPGCIAVVTYATKDKTLKNQLLTFGTLESFQKGMASYAEPHTFPASNNQYETLAVVEVVKTRLPVDNIFESMANVVVGRTRTKKEIFLKERVLARNVQRHSDTLNVQSITLVLGKEAAKFVKKKAKAAGENVPFYLGSVEVKLVGEKPVEPKNDQVVPNEDEQFLVQEI